MDMMRILVTTMPMRGHVDPTVPIVKELISVGHKVSCYIDGNFKSELEKLGICVIPAKSQFSYNPVDFTFFNFIGASREMIKQGKYVLVDWSIEQYKIIEPEIKKYKPDIILTDCLFFASLLLAKKYKIPCAVFGLIPYPGSFEGAVRYGVGWQPASTSPAKIVYKLANIVIDHFLLGKIYSHAKRRFHDKGIRCPFDKGHFYDSVIDLSDIYLQGSLKEFEYEIPNIPKKVKFIGPSIRVGSTRKPGWMTRFDDKSRPMVFATQGTVQNNPEFLLKSCIEALVDEDIDLIISSGRSDQPIQCSGKENLIIKPEVSYHHILPKCDVFVTNGGFGGVNLALKYGVPMAGPI